jgi:DNA-directed RNA polymerase
MDANVRGTLTTNVLAGTTLAEQAQAELRGIELGQRRFRLTCERLIERQQAGRIRSLGRAAGMWTTTLAAVYAQVLQRQSEKPDATHAPGVMLIRQMRPKQAAAVTIDLLLNMACGGPDGALQRTLCYHIGKHMLSEATLARVRRKLKHEHADASAELRTTDGDAETVALIRKRIFAAKVRLRSMLGKKRPYKARLVAHYYEDSDPRLDQRIMLTRAGMLLLLTAIDTLEIETPEGPTKAFIREQQYRGGHSCPWVIRPTPALIVILNDALDREAKQRPFKSPMLCRPLSWSDGKGMGGYVTIRRSLITHEHPVQRRITKIAHDAGCLAHVYQGIDALNGTALLIDREVLRAASTLRDSGAPCRAMPEPEDVPLPACTYTYDPSSPIKRKQQYLTWRGTAEGLAFRAARKYERLENKRRRNARRTLSLLLAEAKARGARPFWISSRLARNGRQVPDCDHLHQHGPDLASALLTFADVPTFNNQPQRLTERGRYWCAINLANTYGNGWDKMPLDQRVTFPDKYRAEIAEVARDPARNQWWTTAGKKTRWQFMQACRAWMDEKVAVRTPISIDATCNGYQWWAALTGDEDLARRVNVLPTGQRQDVYDDVAPVLRAAVQLEMLTTPATAHFGDWCLPFITRDSCKYNVLTTTYGVLRKGRVDQFFDAFCEAGMPAGRAYACAKYLAPIMERVMVKLAEKSMQAMQWLRNCAREIGTSGRPVVILSPLGLPVVLPYFASQMHRVATIKGQVTMWSDWRDNKPDVPKTERAVAAIYVHLLDATHNLANAIDMQRRRCPYLSRHDQYTSAPNTMDTLVHVAWTQFKALAELPLLAMTHAQWSALYPDLSLPNPPAVRTLALRDVAHNPYFAS